VTNKWLVDSGATRHICAKRNVFSSYSSVGDGEKQVYLCDSRTTSVLGKGKVLLKLTSGKTLALSDMLNVLSLRVNLVSIALLENVRVKVSFESDKIVMKKIIYLWEKDIVIKVFLYSMFLKLLMNLDLCLLLILLTLMIFDILD